MKQSKKDLIIELHGAVNNERSKELEIQFPELFKLKPLEVGKWYNVGHRYTICIDNVNGFRASIHGFKDGYWFEYKDFQIINGYYKLIPATDKEVETALIKEAIQIGFRKGGMANLKTVNENYINSATFENNDFIYDSSENTLELDGFIIFENGKWATIIETITKEQAEKELGKTILN